jgi:iron-sulfur cluster assembly accessory protein
MPEAGLDALMLILSQQQPSSVPVTLNEIVGHHGTNVELADPRRPLYRPGLFWAKCLINRYRDAEQGMPAVLLQPGLPWPVAPDHLGAPGRSGMSAPGLSLSEQDGSLPRGRCLPSSDRHTSMQERLQMTVQGEATTKVLLTDAAAAKVSGLLQQEGRDDLRLRIAVQPGGCSGLRYQLYFDERDLDGDVVTEFGSVQVVTDRMSFPYLGGATIDFVDTIEKQGFTIDNPNATGSCACGDSFH